jgi:hypothetical protein
MHWMQDPTVELVDEHMRPVPHPLPPDPRHPLTHRFVRSSQTRPLCALPHATSALHSPHIPDGGHTLERQSAGDAHV